MLQTNKTKCNFSMIILFIEEHFFSDTNWACVKSSPDVKDNWVQLDERHPGLITASPDLGKTKANIICRLHSAQGRSAFMIPPWERCKTTSNVKTRTTLMDPKPLG